MAERDMSSAQLRDVNLAQSSLGTSVTCDTVSSSVTPLESLLVPGPRHWMADTFIRPPVSLSLHLPVPVRLASISWDTRLGSQASSFFEVSSYSYTLIRNWHQVIFYTFVMDLELIIQTIECILLHRSW